MAFDPNPHLQRMIVYRCGTKLFPDEKNMTEIYAKTCQTIGIVPIQLNSLHGVSDPYADLMRLMVITCGEKLREARGQDRESDLEKLYREAALELGIPEPPPKPVYDPEHPPQGGVSKFPSPEETGPFGECPKCHKQTLVIKSLCLSCEKAEGGKYKTEWKCTNKECDYDEVSALFLVQAYNQFGILIPEGMKKALGIKTVTDEGER